MIKQCLWGSIMKIKGPDSNPETSVGISVTQSQNRLHKRKHSLLLVTGSSHWSIMGQTQLVKWKNWDDTPWIHPVGLITDFSNILPRIEKRGSISRCFMNLFQDVYIFFWLQVRLHTHTWAHAHRLRRHYAESSLNVIFLVLESSDYHRTRYIPAGY